ncbi:MAG: alanine glycine permease, partial [Lachnospiraceae bacterium]
MEAALNNIFSTIGSYLSNYILIVALLGGGIWFTVKLGFIQVKGFGEG